MLKIEHVCAEPYFHDISFTLEDYGMICISSSDSESEKLLADIFCGIQSIQKGKFQIDDFSVCKETLLEYRKHYVSSLVSDFQIIKNKCVKDVVCMHLSYEEQAYYEIMNLWDLYTIEKETMQDLSFEQCFRVLLARCMLKESKVLVFYPDSTPLSLKEREYVYGLLQKCSEYMLVIIIGDKKASYYADRSIEFHDGYLESDDQGIILKNKKQIKQGKVKPYSYPSFLSYRYRYRFVYRALRVVMILILGCFSLFFLCTNLNVVDMQMKILEKHGQQHFLIEKHAQDFLGNIYPRQYMQFQDKDIKELEKNIKGNVMVSYAPVDFYMANAYLNGIYTTNNVPFVSTMGVYEAENMEDTGIKLVSGYYPKEYNEAALTLDAARYLINEQGTSFENYLGKVFYWYGIPLRISGIVEEISYEHAKEKQMPYMNDTYLFVKKGFIQHHPLSNMQSFPLSSKRMLINNRSYEINRFSENPHYLYYTNGSMVLNSLDTLKENEVVLDFQSAVLLGFPYHRIFFDENKTYEEKIWEYLVYIEQWINQSIRVQAYTISTNPDASAFFQKDFIIKGFLLPDDDEIEQGYIDDNATIYMKQSVLEPYVQSGAGIQNVMYYGKKDQLESTLHFLYTNDTYDAVLPSDDVFRLLVLDIQDLSIFLLGSSVCLLLLYGIVMMWLLKRTMKHMKEEMSIWYAYGNSRKSIQKEYEKTFLKYIKKDVWTGLCVSLFFSFIYLILLVWKLEAMPQQFLYLGMILLVSISIYFLKKGVLLYVLHKEAVLPDWYAND